MNSVTKKAVAYLSAVLSAAAPVWAAAADDLAMFPRETWDVSLTGGYGTPVLGDNERFTSVVGSVGYYFADNLSLNAGLGAHYVDPFNGGENTAAGEFHLKFRWHFLEFDRWTIFADGGAGILYASHEVPRGGTHFNFTPQAGLGATYELKENLHLIGGAELFHISNAGIQGDDRHPGSNAITAYIGLLWTF